MFQDLVEVLVNLGSFVSPAASELDAVLHDPLLDRVPVDGPGPDPPWPTVDPPDFAGRLRSAHDPSRAMNGRIQTLLRLWRIDPLQNYGGVAHGRADEALLAGKGGRAPLADNPELLAEML